MIAAIPNDACFMAMIFDTFIQSEVENVMTRLGFGCKDYTLRMHPIDVSQDGSCFYNELSGRLIYRSLIIVQDWDIVNAKKAKKDFLMWAERKGIIVRFV